MVKEKILLKEEVKYLAETIKCTKQKLKNTQRDLSKLQKNKFPYHNDREKKDLEKPITRYISKITTNVNDLKISFRIKHIVNSMIRGRSIKEIEPKTKNDYTSILKKVNIYSEAKHILKDLGYGWRE